MGPLLGSPQVVLSVAVEPDRRPMAVLAGPDVGPAQALGEAAHADARPGRRSRPGAGRARPAATPRTATVDGRRRRRRRPRRCPGRARGSSRSTASGGEERQVGPEHRDAPERRVDQGDPGRDGRDRAAAGRLLAGVTDRRDFSVRGGSGRADFGRVDRLRPGREGRVGGQRRPTTTRTSAAATAPSTRVSSGTPATVRAGLGVPPRRRAAPPASTTAANLIHDPPWTSIRSAAVVFVPGSQDPGGCGSQGDHEPPDPPRAWRGAQAGGVVRGVPAVGRSGAQAVSAAATLGSAVLSPANPPAPPRRRPRRVVRAGEGDAVLGQAVAVGDQGRVVGPATGPPPGPALGRTDAQACIALSQVAWSTPAGGWLPNPANPPKPPPLPVPPEGRALGRADGRTPPVRPARGLAEAAGQHDAVAGQALGVRGEAVATRVGVGRRRGGGSSAGGGQSGHRGGPDQQGAPTQAVSHCASSRIGPDVAVWRQRGNATPGPMRARAARWRIRPGSTLARNARRANSEVVPRQRRAGPATLRRHEVHRADPAPGAVVGRRRGHRGRAGRRHRDGQPRRADHAGRVLHHGRSSGARSRWRCPPPARSRRPTPGG